MRILKKMIIIAVSTLGAAFVLWEHIRVYPAPFSNSNIPSFLAFWQSLGSWVVGAIGAGLIYRQIKLAESQDSLNKLLLQREEDDAAERRLNRFFRKVAAMKLSDAQIQVEIEGFLKIFDIEEIRELANLFYEKARYNNRANYIGLINSAYNAISTRK
jgi:hypothetical protein